MRLIDADKYKQTLEYWIADIESTYDKEANAECRVILDCICQLDDAPTIDAVPVRYGRWIVKRYAPGGRGRTVRFCSECGANNWNRKSNYCPNCGIRMRGEEYAVDL